MSWGRAFAEGVEVAVVGGGPVGLALGCLLAAGGVSVAVLERRPAPSGHSRSIGIHPPALEALAPTGAVPELLARGVRVRRGHAYAGRRRLGTLSFGTCAPPHRFVLTVPQAVTERVLERRLYQLDAGALRRGAAVTRVEQGPHGAAVTLAGGPRLEAALVVACDGHASGLRRRLAVPVRAREHPDRFVMGDFPDATDLGEDAAIYLTNAGVVESFPLPGGMRRWVAAVDPAAWHGGRAFAAGVPDAAAAQRLAAVVRRRVGAELDAEACSMVSAFGVGTLLAARMTLGRVALAGDAAHVMPPFGGQGMNLGWLDASALAAAVSATRAGGHLGRAPAEALQRALAGYERMRAGAAVAAARRAEFNLAVGRAGAWSAVRAGLVWAGLRSPLAPVFARRFTMRGLEAGARVGSRGAPAGRTAAAGAPGGAATPAGGSGPARDAARAGSGHDRPATGTAP